ncbi:hypothetical protein [uncultured Roseobacter sp.]|uniref:hypothetical protein n=1 Tax=uncultured Roseobacter sp. TaxID=114847 RepID=UPI002622685E|nr:hypothetical protein [uncultured Roseobacter sp.]
MRVLAMITAFGLVAACTDLPDVPETAEPWALAADYPVPGPLTPLAQETAAKAAAEDETSEQLEARAAGLRARAAGLRAPVMTDAERARLAQTQ